MPLLRMNAPFGAGDPVLDFPEIAVRKMLAATRGQSITILLHGYRFSPFGHKNNPHSQIFSFKPDQDQPNCISWPHHLGFERGHENEGLCIAFAWHARGTIWQAYRRAIPAAKSLAHLIEKLRAVAPDRKINVMAHSLGARVLLSALTYLPAKAIDRVVLMAGAELSAIALEAIRTPAGRQCEVLNITSRENDIYDLLIETAIAPLRPFSRSLGHGLSAPCRNWVDLQLDCPKTLMSLRKQGFRIAPPARRVCHWSAYLRAGMFPLYRQFLNAPAELSLEDLSSACPRSQSRRWSRLLARPLLSSGHKR